MNGSEKDIMLFEVSSDGVRSHAEWTAIIRPNIIMLTYRAWSDTIRKVDPGTQCCTGIPIRSMPYQLTADIVHSATQFCHIHLRCGNQSLNCGVIFKTQQQEFFDWFRKAELRSLDARQDVTDIISE